MTRIAVIEHEAQCPPAHLGTWLEAAGAELDVRRPWAGDDLPGAGEHDALVVLGGSMGANDDALHHWLAPTKDLIRDSVAREVPLLGVCLGHQLIGAALGGTVKPGPGGQQVGLYDVGWLDGAADDELVGGLGPVRGIQWNHDLVTKLPEGAVALAETPTGELQVARFGRRAWGVQLHPEADEPVVTSWAAGDRDDHLERGIDQPALLAEIHAAREELDAAWRPVASRFVELVEDPG
jgi:GMP synthase (glutamine-hydrolysing)